MKLHNDVERRCPKCKEIKQKSEFYKSGSYCKVCSREVAKNYRLKKEQETIRIISEMIKEGKLTL